MAARVEITAEAREQLRKAPIVIVQRVEDVIRRLYRWPEVSGAKPLRYGLKGHYRIRTGNWRVVFAVAGEVVTVVRIDNRRDVYDG